MADIKQLKDQIWLTKRDATNERSKREEWASTLPGIEAELETMASGPDRDEWVLMKTEAEKAIASHDAAITQLDDKIAALEAQLPQAPTPAQPKFDPEKHPALRKAATEKQEPEKPVAFRTGDMCEAQWTDRSWYKAKIQSILGSASAPKYLVKFVEYDDTLTVDASAVRPLAAKRKREPEPATPTPAPVTSTPHVISGPASLNPAVKAATDPAAADALPKRANKIPNKGQLKKSVGNWQNFQAKGVGKKFAKRESMFRTSDAEGSRVGFTGSGKGMTETHKRQRYDKKKDLADDEHLDKWEKR